MISKWKPGTRVRVKDTVTDGLAGSTGTIEEAGYALEEESTSVALDSGDDQAVIPGLFFYDEELEEL